MGITGNIIDENDKIVGCLVDDNLSLIGILSNDSESLCGELSYGINADDYSGSYTVIPSLYDDIVLETSNKRMVDDVTVKKVPSYETSNEFGGTTFYIGG